MKLPVFVLKKNKLLEEVVITHVEAGVAGTTLLEAERLGVFLSSEASPPAGLKKSLNANSPYDKSILSVIQNDGIFEKHKTLHAGSFGRLEDTGTGIRSGWAVPDPHSDILRKALLAVARRIRRVIIGSPAGKPFSPQGQLA